MENNFPWGTPRRLNAYSDFLRRTYGYRIQKLSVNAGFSCPNRDGALGRADTGNRALERADTGNRALERADTGNGALGRADTGNGSSDIARGCADLTRGCIYCNNSAFHPSYCEPTKSITQQLEEGKEFHAWRYRHTCKYMAYFQAFSNTYAPMDVLRRRYEEALAVEGVIGLAIGTRPDCAGNDVLDYLCELRDRGVFVHLEMGIESCYDKSLRWMRRGHDFACAVDAFERAAKRRLSTGTHLILGLPTESLEEELKEARILSELPINTLKLHQLQIIRGTDLEKEYASEPSRFRFWQAGEYIDFVIDFLERLSPRIMIERLSGEAPPRFQAGPVFGLRADRILQMLEKRMEERQTRQGRIA